MGLKDGADGGSSEVLDVVAREGGGVLDPYDKDNTIAAHIGSVIGLRTVWEGSADTVTAQAILDTFDMYTDVDRVMVALGQALELPDRELASSVAETVLNVIAYQQGERPHQETAHHALMGGVDLASGLLGPQKSSRFLGAAKLAFLEHSSVNSRSTYNRVGHDIAPMLVQIQSKLLKFVEERTDNEADLFQMSFDIVNYNGYITPEGHDRACRIAIDNIGNANLRPVEYMDNLVTIMSSTVQPDILADGAVLAWGSLDRYETDAAERKKELNATIDSTDTALVEPKKAYEEVEYSRRQAKQLRANELRAIIKDLDVKKAEAHSGLYDLEQAGMRIGALNNYLIREMVVIIASSEKGREVLQLMAASDKNVELDDDVPSIEQRLASTFSSTYRNYATGRTRRDDIDDESLKTAYTFLQEELDITPEL